MSVVVANNANNCATLMILFYWLKQSKICKTLDEANRTGKTFDMKMNANNTKSMLVSKDVHLITVILKIDGDIIKQTDKDTYLDKNYNTKWKM